MATYKIPLSRALEYTEREDVAFVREGVNEVLYEIAYREKTYSEYNLKALQGFNEVYFFCAKLLHTPLPMEFMDEEIPKMEKRLNPLNAHAILSMASLLLGFVRIDDEWIREDIKAGFESHGIEFVYKEQERMLTPSKTFPLTPAPLSKLGRYSPQEWRGATDNFSQDGILGVLAFRKTYKEKKDLLDLIKEQELVYEEFNPPMGFEDFYNNLYKIIEEETKEETIEEEEAAQIPPNVMEDMEAEIAALKAELEEVRRSYAPSAKDAEICKAIDSMIDYALNLPSNKNKDADAVALMMHCIFGDDLKKEQREKLKCVGKKEQPSVRNEITNNDTINIRNEF